MLTNELLLSPVIKRTIVLPAQVKQFWQQDVSGPRKAQLAFGCSIGRTE
jgi:hypothetical protein